MPTTSEAQLILIRPGTTDFDQQGRIIGTLDIPLNDAGKAEVRRVGEQLAELDVQLIYFSPSQAARESAELIADSLDRKTKTNDNLRNLDHGLWQGKQMEEVKKTQRKVYRRWQEQPESVCPPEGETLAAVRQRIETFIARLRKKHKSGVVALVAPDPYASILKALMQQEEIGYLWNSESQSDPWESIAIAAPNKLVAVGESR